MLTVCLRSIKNKSNFRCITKNVTVGTKLNLENKIDQRQCSTEVSEDITIKSPLPDFEIPNRTLSEHAFYNVHLWKDKTALTCSATKHSYTYEEIFSQSCCMAINLKRIIKMEPGETVAIVMPNIPEYAIAIHGCLIAGLIITFVNPLYTRNEIFRQIVNAETKLLITIHEMVPAIKSFGLDLPGYKGVVSVGGSDDKQNKIFAFEKLLEKICVPLPDIDPNSIAFLPFSSGTSGMPKGVQLSHRNIVSNIIQSQNKMLFDQITDVNNVQQHVIVSPLSYYHAFGNTGISTLTLSRGFHLVTLPRFTPEHYIHALERYQPQTIFVIPKLFQFLAKNVLITKRLLASVTTIVSGASHISPDIITEFKRKVERDVFISQNYGLTEAPLTIMTTHNMPESKINSCGVLVPNAQAKIVDLTTGQSLGPNKPGELHIRGPHVMVGYWKNEAATNEVKNEKGWLRTGDIGYYDEDQYFYIVDRLKELIKVGGHQVSPNELEQIILEIDGIEDVAVIGIPDEMDQEVPRAFIVLKPNVENVNENTVKKYVETQVSHFKKLAGGVQFIDKLPKDETGKLRRNVLKNSYFDSKKIKS